ncbi:hypothetical protein [Sutterella sp.]|uniref:hypothetical protein n=1 Tax=Sutterella sp. TaxID=1981025 RepID=UPI0026E04760|nr:hypothetical protein [Sutterella sp.]MDO5531447.1 hypothetical protein [Sutterella sp.]
MAASTYLKAGAIALALVIAAAGGWRARDLRAERDEAKLYLQWADDSLALSEDYRQREKAHAEDMAKLEAQVRKTTADVARVSARADRLQRELTAASRRLPGSGDAELAAKLTSCTRLLGRGAGLVGRGVELSGVTAVERDGLLSAGK